MRFNEIITELYEFIFEAPADDPYGQAAPEKMIDYLESKLTISND